MKNTIRRAEKLASIEMVHTIFHFEHDELRQTYIREWHLRRPTSVSLYLLHTVYEPISIVELHSAAYSSSQLVNEDGAKNKKQKI